MKFSRLLCLPVLACILLTTPVRVSAQPIAVGGETGLNLFARSGANLALPIGAQVEWDINGRLSLLGRISFDVGLGVLDFNLLYLNPEVRYHFGEVFDGPYVGGFVGFGPTSFNGFYVAFGAAGGYAIPISEHFNIDVSAQFGYGNTGNSIVRVSGLHFRPTAGLRYRF